MDDPRHRAETIRNRHQHFCHRIAICHVTGNIVDGQSQGGILVQKGQDLMGPGRVRGLIRMWCSPHQGHAHTGFLGYCQGAGGRDAPGPAGDEDHVIDRPPDAPFWKGAGWTSRGEKVRRVRSRSYPTAAKPSWVAISARVSQAIDFRWQGRTEIHHTNAKILPFQMKAGPQGHGATPIQPGETRIPTEEAAAELNPGHGGPPPLCTGRRWQRCHAGPHTNQPVQHCRPIFSS
jgi:hypothetical protein